MRPWTLVIAVCALLGAALWHLPATAQRASAAAPADPSASPAAVSPAPRPAAPELITFDEYRDFRMRDLAQRRARLESELSAADLSATEKASLEGRKAYYERLAAMSGEERDRLFRARFDLIDTNRDGTLDSAERAAWRGKQREHYRQLTAERAASPSGAQH